MKFSINYKTFTHITDNTSQIDANTLFVLTAQNSKYYDLLDPRPTYITPKELISHWSIDTLSIIGVTGTNGKTTVTAVIYSLLLDLDEKPALQGTRGLFANEKQLEQKSMTTPSILETLHNMKQVLDAGCNYFIMEVSSHAIEQQRIQEISFALKVHTNVTSDHLDYHGTVEEYRRVKSLFFDDETPKLLNKDDIRNITFNSLNALTYGIDEPASYKVQAFSMQHGLTAGIKYQDQEATFHSPMVGLFNLYNLMAAIGSVSMLTSRALQEICDVVENFAGVGGRMEVVHRQPLVIVDFAHTDDGMAQVLGSIKDKDISVVFGAGGDRDKSKRAKMGAVAGRFAKKTYVTSDNPRSEIPEMILEDILVGLAGKENVVATPDRRLAIEMAIEALEPDEVLMILGKGDENYQEIAGIKHPFDDRVIAREILSKKYPN